MTVIRGKIVSGPVQVLPDDNRVPLGIPRQFLAYQVYTLRITKIYKGNEAIRRTGGLRVYGRRRRSYTIKIYTPSKKNSCRVDFTMDKVYVVAGYIGRKKLSISGCDYKQEWRKVTRKQRSGFARKYYGNCECKHAICYGDDCRKKKISKMSCAFDMSSSLANKCRDKYQYCRLSYNARKCVWTDNSQYKNCIKKIP